MPNRFVGVRKDGNINVVSSSPFTSEDITTHAMSEELSDKTSSDIIANYHIRQEHIVRRHAHVPAHSMKVALVGNWKMRCGIATYAESIWPLVAKLVGDVKLFIEDDDVTTGVITSFGDQTLSDDKVVRCWKRGEPLGGLIAALDEYEPDVVWVQHEFGIFPNAGHWLSFASRARERYCLVVTMHSVFHHRDKTICEAVIPNIVVHLQGAMDVLKQEKYILGNVVVIPHGCAPCVDRTRLWNVYRTNNTFMQFGFGFRYKGWETSIRTVYELKKKHPDVFFTGLFSESQFASREHQTYYDELTDLIASLGLKQNIALIRGYQTDVALDSFMRTNTAIVFPYESSGEHEVFGASGTARVAMTAGIPVVTTHANHFSDVPSLKADTPEALASVLSNMFLNDVARQVQVEKQVAYTLENSWAKCAERYVAVFANALTGS